MSHRNSTYIAAITALFFFACAAPAPAQAPASTPAKAVSGLSQTVFLVRHAEKAKDGTKDPALTEAGNIRAIELARVLGDVKPKAVFATQYQRTQATVAPLAKQAGLTVEIVDADTPEVLIKKISAMSGTFVVAGHSNTLGPLVVALGAPAVPEIDYFEYDGLYVVHRGPSGATVSKLRFGPPNPPKTPKPKS